MRLFKKNIFGQYLFIKKWIIRILGAFSHQRYQGFNDLQIEGSEILRQLPETNVLFISNHQTYFADVVAMFHVFNASLSGRDDSIKNVGYLWNPKLNLYYVAAKETMKAGLLPKIFAYAGSISIERTWRSSGKDVNRQVKMSDISNIKKACVKAKVPMPNIYTEFGSFTVGESMAHIYKVLAQKKQNDRECWYMIDSSFITTLPDTWGIGEKFLMLPVNKWENDYQRVVLGGITCDSHDYYDSEEHINEVFLPKLKDDTMNEKEEENKEPLYVGFFHTGAYQDQISGYGGIKHCLIPSPKHVIVEMDEKTGKLVDSVYAKEQSAQSMLKILGYLR